MQTKTGYLILLIAGLTISCGNPTDPADAIYYNGSILTIDDSTEGAEALAIKNGLIQDLGKRKAIMRSKGEATELIDLKGSTLLPGFIDGHSHFSIGMKMLHQADLSSPPVGVVRNIEDLIVVLKSHQQKYGIPSGGWILGWGYDPDQLEEKRHPNARELSAAFPDNPVLLLHVSFHMCVVNDKALELAGITADTPDPAGGRIVREAESNVPNGLLQEVAMYQALGLLPQPDVQQMSLLLQETQEFYASKGITTAQDGLTDIATYEFLRKAAESGDLYIDIEALASFRDAEAFLKNHTFGQSFHGLRLSGMKIVTDGSPQGKTAFFRDPYRTAVPGCLHHCRGFPTMNSLQIEQFLGTCYGSGIQVFAHANGDAAIELLLTSHESVIDSLKIDSDGLRTVVIHSQFVRPDQLEKYKKWGFIPSFFSNHAFFWGDVHLENLGEERATFLSPLKSASEFGIPATNHTDFVITPLDQMFLLWTAVNRKTRSGMVLGPEERLTPREALKTITINGAYQHKTEESKGSLEAGKLADLVILDRNPLEIHPDSIKSVRVLRTIKGGKVVYNSEEPLSQ